MEDWQVNNGRINFQVSISMPMLICLLNILKTAPMILTSKADLGLFSGVEAAAGISLGIKDELYADIKAACYWLRIRSPKSN